MGVSGSGKTTIGRLLADTLGWSFHEGDALHPPANVEKMRHGVPLTDADRAPWLDAVARLIAEVGAAGRFAVVACSALKQAYRDRLAATAPGVVLVHVTGDPALLRARLAARTGHFMPVELLPSQLATLEPPADAITVDVAGTPDEIVALVRSRLGV